MQPVHTTATAVMAACALGAFSVPALANHTPGTSGLPATAQAPYQAPPNPAPPQFAPVPERPAPGARDGSGVALTVQQLLINQRISQAAVRRANAVQAWLDAGIVEGDFAGGGLGAPDFLSSSVTTLILPPPPHAITPASPRPVTPESGEGREGDSLVLSPAQVLINQRISQAAVRRSNALQERLEGGLTGGDIVDGNVTLEKLQGFLDIQTATPVPNPPAASQTQVAEPNRSGDPVALTAAQLLINQRISQAAVRRSNALIDQLTAGLSGANFQDGTITAVDLEADLRS